MKKEDLVSFLNFRKKFSKREWSEINKIVADREREKADKLELNNFDIAVILEKIEDSPWIWFKILSLEWIKEGNK